MLEGEVRINVTSELPWADTVAIRLGNRQHDTMFVARPVTMDAVKQGQQVEPMVRLPRDAAQTLFEQLWLIGFRPREGYGTHGQVGAMKDHLEDMRRLVFRSPPPAAGG